MTALAHSLMRIWSAKNRVPHLTGWGTSGSLLTAAEKATLVRRAHQAVLKLIEVARRTAPTVFVIAYNIFR
jgi:hypothetical protein